MFAMFDDEREREEEDGLEVEPEEIEDLDTLEKEADEVEGGMMRREGAVTKRPTGGPGGPTFCPDC